MYTVLYKKRLILFDLHYPIYDEIKENTEQKENW